MSNVLFSYPMACPLLKTPVNNIIIHKIIHGKQKKQYPDKNIFRDEEITKKGTPPADRRGDRPREQLNDAIITEFNDARDPSKQHGRIEPRGPRSTV